MNPVLIVLYLETKDHYTMAKRCILEWQKMGANVTCVINRWLDGAERFTGVEYIESPENCLGLAWNIGLKHLYKTNKRVIVSGFDSMPLEKYKLEAMDEYLRINECGMIGGNSNGNHRGLDVQYMEHGDGSFSLFILDREAFEKAQGFPEIYKPAYFEDNHFLEVLWSLGYKPVLANYADYYHIGQGTIRGGGKIKKEYGEFMNRNLEIFKKRFGKVPDHLPPDITFIS